MTFIFMFLLAWLIGLPLFLLLGYALGRWLFAPIPTEAEVFEQRAAHWAKVRERGARIRQRKRTIKRYPATWSFPQVAGGHS